MISATLYKGKNGFTGCRITGHSGWAESGGDIICAAVSILGCTCVNALESICGVVPDVTEYNEEDGTLMFELPEMTEAENEKAQILMKALRQGLEDLEKGYPQYVRLSMKNGGN